MAQRPRIVITGAAGNLGRKLRAHLEASGNYDLVLTDLDSGGDPDIVEADLSDTDSGWVDLLDGADVLVHLAANISSHAPWPALQAANVDATLALYDSAASRGLRRIVFASSNQVMGGYRGASEAITSTLPERPTNFYGASKAMGERIGRLYAKRHGMSVINLRIGTINRGDNPPPRRSELADQLKWLSNGDFCRAVELAIMAPDVTFANLFLMSDNAGSLWDLEETRTVLGFVPADRTEPRPPPISARIRRFLARIKNRIVGRLGHGGARPNNLPARDG